MSTRLYRDGFCIEPFYAADVGELADQVGAMLRFALPGHSADLEHQDCRHQLRDGLDGQFILLFGGLERVRSALEAATAEALSLSIYRAFYLVKRGDYDGYATTIQEMSDLLAQSARGKEVANDA